MFMLILILVLKNIACLKYKTSLVDY